LGNEQRPIGGDQRGGIPAGRDEAVDLSGCQVDDGDVVVAGVGDVQGAPVPGQRQRIGAAADLRIPVWGEADAARHRRRGGVDHADLIGVAVGDIQSAPVG
jgi:hypothetical protein